MPQFIIPAIASLGVSTAVATVIYYAAVLVISMAIANNQAKRARRKAINDYNASLQDRLVMQALYNAARSIAYGRVRNTGGVLFKGTWGPDKRYYTFVVAMMHGKCDGIEAVFFNDKPLSLLSDGAGGFWVDTEPFKRLRTESRYETATAAGGAGSIVLASPPDAGTVSGSGPDDMAVNITSVVGSTVNF